MVVTGRGRKRPLPVMARRAPAIRSAISALKHFLDPGLPFRFSRMLGRQAFNVVLAGEFLDLDGVEGRSLPIRPT